MDILMALTMFVLGLLGVIFLGAVIIVVIVIIMACRIAFKRVMEAEDEKDADA